MMYILTYVIGITLLLSLLVDYQKLHASIAPHWKVVKYSPTDASAPEPVPEPLETATVEPTNGVAVSARIATQTSSSRSRLLGIMKRELFGDR